MRKAIYIFGMFAATAMLMACGATKPAASASLTETDAARAAGKFPGATLASLNEGKMLYEQHCGSCHGLKKTNDYNEAEWRKIVPPMAGKAEIDKKKEDLILQYVVTMGRP
jgi:cytochrome c5